MAQTGLHYEQNEWLRVNNYVNIQGMIMVLVHSTYPDCHLSINQVPFQSLLYFQDMARQTSIMKRMNGYGEITL